MLYIIRGLPGSGKTTLAKQLVRERHVHLYREADQYFTCLSGIYFFQPHRLKDAHAWCQMQVRTALGAGLSVAVSNTFVQRWEIAPYVEMAQRWNTPFTIMQCTGEWGSVHDVPPSTIERMRQRWEQLSEEDFLQTPSNAVEVRYLK